MICNEKLSFLRFSDNILALFSPQFALFLEIQVLFALLTYFLGKKSISKSHFDSSKKHYHIKMQQLNDGFYYCK